MPALQQVFRSVANIYAREQSINALTEHLYQQPRVITSVNEQGDNQQLTFSNQIELIDVSYRYPNCQQTSLANIHLTVPEQSSLGIVGPTGSGKSTLINLMLGLIEPETGTIYIDNTVLNQDNIEAWQNNIGYVPQDIYLADRTIKENIAFEIDDNDIDEHAVHRAACSAHIHDFIQNELPKGYDTIVGERGIRLSGGQKQRLGIARALYYDPQVLVLDEATSALDPNTEKLVLDTIYTAAQNRTVILVTHRLASIHNCDKIIFMEQGQIKSAGTYNDLLNANETFSQMSQANNA
jgi:ABC-type multidrug transport system fused ATPase/permease subunit